MPAKKKTDKEIETEIENKLKSKFEKWDKKGGGSHDSMSALYGLGFVGALIYYIQLAENFIEGLVAIPRAIIWPATVIYKWLEAFYGSTNL